MVVSWGLAVPGACSLYHEDVPPSVMTDLTCGVERTFAHYSDSHASVVVIAVSRFILDIWNPKGRLAP